MLVVNRGNEFENCLMEEFVDIHKASIHYITADILQSNGITARFHLTIIEHLRILRKRMESMNIKEQMTYALFFIL